jgi:hypothetical protein
LSKNNITILDDQLTIELTDENDDSSDLEKCSWTETFSISELISKHSQDHGCIAIFPKMVVDGYPLVAAETTQLTLTTRGMVSTFETTPGKIHASSPFSVISRRMGSYAYLYILTPSVNCAPEDLIFVYRDSSANVTN